MEATSVSSTQITSNCKHVKGLCNETFKIPVASKQRLYPLTECNVGIVWKRKELRLFDLIYSFIFDKQFELKNKIAL